MTVPEAAVPAIEAARAAAPMAKPSSVEATTVQAGSIRVEMGLGAAKYRRHVGVGAECWAGERGRRAAERHAHHGDGLAGKLRERSGGG